MTKADIVAKISEKLGLEKGDVQTTIETFMEEVKTSLESGDNVYLRGFGSFIIKTRAEKTGRNISKNTTIKIPAHNIPAFKPAKVFVEGVKSNVDKTATREWTLISSKNSRIYIVFNVLLYLIVRLRLFILKSRNLSTLRISLKRTLQLHSIAVFHRNVSK